MLNSGEVSEKIQSILHGDRENYRAKFLGR